MGKKTVAAIAILALVYIFVLVWLVDRDRGVWDGTGKGGGQDTLTVWYWDDSIRPLFDEFAAGRKDLVLDYIYVPNYDYAEKLRSAISFSEDLPDICILQDKYAGDFINLSIWEDLSGEPYGLDRDTLPKDCLSYITADSGALAAAPYNLAASGLAYRSGMMEQVFGLSEPEEIDRAFPTWESLIEQGTAYQKRSGEPFHLFSSLGDVATVLYNQTERAYIEDGRLVEPERFLEYFKILHKLYDAGLVDTMSQCSKQWYDEFEKGRFLFSPWSMWLTQNKTFSKNKNNDWKLTLPPGGSYKWGGSVLAIPSSGRHKELAWEFIQYIALSEEGAQANKKLPCSQFLYWMEESGDAEYESLSLEGFGNFNVGKYYFDSLLPNMHTRALSPYDSALDLAYHTAVKAISHDNRTTPEQSYQYFLELLYKAAPHLPICKS